MLLLNSWYLEDGILTGTEAEVMLSLDVLESEGKDLGFNLKTSKCIIWSSQTMSSLEANIERADLEGFEIPRAPNGTDTHHAKVFSMKVEKTASPRSLTAT